MQLVFQVDCQNLLSAPDWSGAVFMLQLELVIGVIKIISTKKQNICLKGTLGRMAKIKTSNIAYGVRMQIKGITPPLLVRVQT